MCRAVANDIIVRLKVDGAAKIGLFPITSEIAAFRPMMALEIVEKQQEALARDVSAV